MPGRGREGRGRLDESVALLVPQLKREGETSEVCDADRCSQDRVHSSVPQRERGTHPSVCELQRSFSRLAPKRRLSTDTVMVRYFTGLPRLG